MRICAVTMVYRDHWALSQWYRHYARHVGAENLFVVAHGADPEVPKICPGASVLTIPRASLRDFDRVRNRVLNGLQNGLGEIYDWVIRTDADELICLDPSRWASFEDLFAAQQGNALFSLGLNIAEADGDPPLSPGQSVLEARRNAEVSAHYCKAWAVRNRVTMLLHGIHLRRAKLPDTPFVLPHGVYLAHLKFACLDSLEAANRHRVQIANGAERGLPGAAWKNAGDEAQRFYRRIAQRPHLPWADAVSAAHARVTADPLRDPQRGLLRVRFTDLDMRVELPDWFARA